MPPVIHTDRPLFRQLFDLVDRIRHAVHQIFIFRHPAGMTEEIIASQLRITPAHFKSRADTGCNMIPRILNLHHDLGTEVHPCPVGASVFLGPPQIAEHGSLIF